MKLAVIIPCYKVDGHIDRLISQIPDLIQAIYLVDDCCPNKSGITAAQNSNDPRLKLIAHEKNGGVGAAVKSGFKSALNDGFDVMVKLDGDGQMNPALIPQLIAPILNHKADYCKGNRFYDVRALMQMPTLRLIGNSALSFINKAVSGYWNVMDPTNGFVAIHRTALSMLPLEQIENRYFFESDMLFRLGTIKAVVHDMPMKPLYADEKSNLSITKVLFEFPGKYTKRFIKRLFYNYFIRDFTVASVEMLLGFALLIFGSVFGTLKWIESIELQRLASTGTVMVAVLPIILGVQLLLQALNYDIQNIPNQVLSLSHRELE